MNETYDAKINVTVTDIKAESKQDAADKAMAHVNRGNVDVYKRWYDDASASDIWLNLDHVEVDGLGDDVPVDHELVEIANAFADAVEMVGGSITYHDDHFDDASFILTILRPPHADAYIPVPDAVDVDYVRACQKGAANIMVHRNHHADVCVRIKQATADDMGNTTGLYHTDCGGEVTKTTFHTSGADFDHPECENCGIVDIEDIRQVNIDE